MQHVPQALLLTMALKFDLKFTERLYFSNVSRNGVLSSSAVYSEAPLILHRAEFSDISGTFIELPALNLEANYKTIVKQLRKKAENGEEGLRSTRLRINCFSKATFTIWLLNKKSQ